MTATQALPPAPGTPPPHAPSERLALMARCNACCAGTGTPHTILALALTGNSNFFFRLMTREMAADSLARCAAALDILEGLNAAAGTLTPPCRIGGRGARGAEAKDALRTVVERVAGRIGVRAPLVALAATHDSTLLHPRGGVSEAQFRTYAERLDRIEAAFTGETDGEETEV